MMKTKPPDCTCQYPNVVFRNMSGHDRHCICHKRHMATKFPGYETIEPSMNETYDRVVARISDGSVTIDDFNQLLSEVLDKSAKERIARRTRLPKLTPKSRSLAGQIVPKRQGRDDPPNQGRGKRYASGKPARKRQNKKQSDEWEKFQVSRAKLESVLLRPVLTEGQVTAIDRLIKDGHLICPGCKTEINENIDLYNENKLWYHRQCGGQIELPAYDWSKVPDGIREVLGIDG